MLTASILAALAAAVGQPWIPAHADDILPAIWPLGVMSIGAGIGLSPFAGSMPVPPAGDLPVPVMRTHRFAYATLLILAAAALVWCAMATAGGWPMPRRTVDWSAWAIAWLVIGTNLPAVLAEWMVPMPTKGNEPGGPITGTS